MEQSRRIAVFGAGGLIGGKISEVLKNRGYTNVIDCYHQTLDLTNQSAVRTFFRTNKPGYFFFCATKSISDFSKKSVGDADELYTNSMMLCNVAQSALENETIKGVFLGSAMLYPWNLNACPERLSEDLLEEYSIKGYSDAMQSAVLSKLFGYKLCEYYKRQYGCNFVYCLPVHIYGGFAGRKNLYFTERLVMDICDAKINGKDELFLDVYGKGEAKKNLLFVDDCADAIVEIMERYESDKTAINVVSDEAITWRQVVDMICTIVQYNGDISFHEDKRENMTNRLCSPDKLAELGWKPKHDLYSGLKELCTEYMTMRGCALP